MIPVRQMLSVHMFLFIVVALFMASGCEDEKRPDAPIISASKGTYEDRIQVTWPPVKRAKSYQIWRADRNDSSVAELKADGLILTSWADRSTRAGERKWYFARAVGKGGRSSFSTGSEGWRKVSPPPSDVTTSGSAAIQIRNNIRLTQTIYINENRVGTVAPYSSRTFRVNPGTHRIRAWDSVYGSASTTRTVSAGQTATVTVGLVSRGHGSEQFQGDKKFEGMPDDG